MPVDDDGGGGEVTHSNALLFSVLLDHYRGVLRSHRRVVALRDQTHQRGRERNARIDTRTVLDWNVVFRSARLSRSKRAEVST